MILMMLRGWQGLSSHHAHGRVAGFSDPLAGMGKKRKPHDADDAAGVRACDPIMLTDALQGFGSTCRYEEKAEPPHDARDVPGLGLRTFRV